MKAEIVLCEKADDNLRNYTNVFDELSVIGQDKLSFTAVCKIIFEGCHDPEIVLHFFLMKKMEGGMKGRYLAEVDINRTEEDLFSEEDTFKLEFKDVPLFEAGTEYFVVVRNDQIKDGTAQQATEIFENGQIIGKAEFLVN